MNLTTSQRTYAPLQHPLVIQWTVSLKCSPDYDQAVMENTFHDVEDAEVYIDDISAFSHS